MALKDLYGTPLRDLRSQAADIVSKKQAININAMKMGAMKKDQEDTASLKAAWDTAGGDLGKFMETEGWRFTPQQNAAIQQASEKKAAMAQSRLGAQELTQAMVGPEVAETGMMGPEDIPQDQIYDAEMAGTANMERQQKLDQYGALAKTIGPEAYGKQIAGVMFPDSGTGGRGRGSAQERIRDQILAYESQDTHTAEETRRYKSNIALQSRRLQGVPPKVSKLAAVLARLEDEGKQDTEEYKITKDKLEEEGMDTVTVKNKAGDEFSYMVPFGEGISEIEFDEAGNPVYNGSGFQLKEKRRQELTEGALTDMQKRADKNKSLIRGLDRIGQLYDPKYLTFANRVGANLDRELDKLVQSDNPAEVELAKGYRAFQRGVAAEFNNYRSVVTGAQAGLEEIKWLEAAFLSGSMDRAQFEAHLQELKYMAGMKQELLDEQITKKKYMTAKDEADYLEPRLETMWRMSGIRKAMSESSARTPPPAKTTVPKAGGSDLRKLWE